MEFKRIKYLHWAQPGGGQPVRDWLLELSKEDRSVIGKGIKRLEYGWPVGMPLCRAMGDGLFELRVRLDSKRAARLFFCPHDGLLIGLHIFFKKTQKTPKEDLELAKQRMRALK